MLLLFVRGVFTATDGGPCGSTECAFPTRELMGTDKGCGVPWDARWLKTCQHQVVKTCGHQYFQRDSQAPFLTPLCTHSVAPNPALFALAVVRGSA